MATFSTVQTNHIRQAIADHDARGAEDFLATYGFAPSSYLLVDDGRTYDAQALLAVAHKYATGRLATPEEFGGGMADAVALLRRRGFEVTEPPGARPAAPPARAATRRSPSPRTPSARGTTTSRRPTPVEDRVRASCPTCWTTLPGTGVCDNCG